MSNQNMIILEHFVANPCYEEWTKLRKRFCVHGPVCHGSVLQTPEVINGHCNSCPLSFRHTKLLIDKDWHGLCWALETYHNGYDSKAFWDEYQGVILQKIIMFLEYVELQEGACYDCK